MRLGASAALLLALLLTSCGPSLTTPSELRNQAEVYSSRIAFAWENLSTFILRGNARLDGASLVARGPFVLWGDPRENLLRGDFYGPDGKPVVSVRGDSAGMLVYFPQEEQASFAPAGLRAGTGTIRTADVIFLIRTGFPLALQQWQITDLADTDEGRILWEFSAGDSRRMVLSMEAGKLFPDRCAWDGGEFTISASSPHDEYRAWPWSWGIRIGDDLVTLELTDIRITPVPDAGIWNLIVPVSIDSLEEAPFWQPSDTLMRR